MGGAMKIHSSSQASPALSSDTPAAEPSVGRRFSEVLRSEPSARPEFDVGEAIESAAGSLVRGQRFMDGALRRAMRGRDLSPQRLLALQAGVYRYTQELELASKVVDKATGAVKQTLQSQQ